MRTLGYLLAGTVSGTAILVDIQPTPEGRRSLSVNGEITIVSQEILAQYVRRGYIRYVCTDTYERYVSVR